MTKTRFKLASLKLEGFRSIASESDSQQIDFQDVTVIIGANGAGKSNFISFFKMLNMMTTHALQLYVGKQGGASAILHYGPKTTQSVEATLCFKCGADVDEYRVKLAHAGRDSLLFVKEQISRHKSSEKSPFVVDLEIGSGESSLLSEIKNDGKADQTRKILLRILSSCRVFQFHDTSPESRVRATANPADEGFLYSDGGNLAAYLYAMRESSSYRPYYERIVRRIRDTVPQFVDFDLTPSTLHEGRIMLNWREEGGGEYRFGPDQLSDGSIRFMALTTLLLQPPDKLPSIIVIDEPELGLHPSAIGALAGMVRTAAKDTQVILATQSQRLVDEFAPEEIVVAEWNRKSRSSSFRRLDSKALDEWLERYSLSELWEKNVLGGQP